MMLYKKMFRDIKKNLSQFITIFLMVMIGVMVYSGINAYMDGMTKTADNFYHDNNLEDLIAIGNFTKKDLEDIKKIDNVKDAERKMVITANTDNDNSLLVSFIESNNISKFYVYDGVGFDKDLSGVWLDHDYAKENDIKVGDVINIKYNSLQLEEKVLGLVNVPGHLYDTRDESELYPDRSTFGFAYLSSKEIDADFIKKEVMKQMNIHDEKVFNMMVKDFNYQEYIPYTYMMVDVDNSNEKDKVKEKIEETITNMSAVINVEDTASYTAYQGEIDEGKTYIGVFSGLFLFIAMLSVITTMSRVVKKERIQIGTLKALGFSNTKIILHYIGYSFWISIIASILGLVLGYAFIGNVFMNMEMEIFAIPSGLPAMGIKNYIMAILVILGISFVTYFTCRKILSESPSEALRTKIPNVNRKSLNITTKGLFSKLKFASKWNIRDIMRNKMRTIMGIAGVTGSCMLIVCALGMLDSMNYFVDLQFSGLYNFKYKLVLKDGINSSELNDLEDVYGNNTSKSYLIEIKKDNKKESNNVFVTDANEYVRFVDKKGDFIKIDSDEGVFITYKLASTDGYKIGDTINWHIYGDDTYYESKIIGFNKDPQNQNMTMTRKYLESLNIKYIPDSIYTNSDLENVKEIKNVQLIQDINSLKEGMNDMLGRMKIMLVMIIGIAVILGSIIIYNLGILSYTEKEYQFATLKVLGFKNKQIRNIFIKQNNWIAIVSIIIGLPLGFYLTDYLFKVAIEEHYDFGASITPLTYLVAAIGTFVVSYIVSRFLSRKIKSIDMVSSLKANE